VSVGDHLHGADNPLVSICVLTRNRAALLQESLRTICAQKYSPVEIVIGDNASTDATERICRDLAENDPRIRYLRQRTDIGIYGNHNACIEASRGPFVCLFHDDDLYDPTIVEEYVGVLQAHPAVGVVCADWHLVDDAGHLVGLRSFGATRMMPGERYIEQTLRSGRSSIALSGAMIRREALGDLRFTEGGPIGFEDFVLWCTLAERWAVGHVGRVLWSYRLHGGSLSRLSILEMAQQYRANLHRYCDERLARRPADAARVRGYRRAIDRYLFWALLYEVCRDARMREGGGRRGPARTIFDLGTYTLTAEELAAAVGAMRQYGTGPLEQLTFRALSVALATGLTRPLAWATRYSPVIRALVKLR
jgi:glycosyltransferase involved in cell wall biosynthesis